MVGRGAVLLLATYACGMMRPVNRHNGYSPMLMDYISMATVRSQIKDLELLLIGQKVKGDEFNHLKKREERWARLGRLTNLAQHGVGQHIRTEYSRWNIFEQDLIEDVKRARESMSQRQLKVGRELDNLSSVRRCYRERVHRIKELLNQTLKTFSATQLQRLSPLGQKMKRELMVSDTEPHTSNLFGAKIVFDYGSINGSRIHPYDSLILKFHETCTNGNDGRVRINVALGQAMTYAQAVELLVLADRGHKVDLAGYPVKVDKTPAYSFAFCRQMLSHRDKISQWLADAGYCMTYEELLKSILEEKKTVDDHDD